MSMAPFHTRFRDLAAHETRKETLFVDSPENKHKAPTIDTGIDSVALPTTAASL